MRLVDRQWKEREKTKTDDEMSRNMNLVNKWKSEYRDGWQYGSEIPEGKKMNRWIFGEKVDGQVAERVEPWVHALVGRQGEWGSLPHRPAPPTASFLTCKWYLPSFNCADECPWSNLWIFSIFPSPYVQSIRILCWLFFQNIGPVLTPLPPSEPRLD